MEYDELSYKTDKFFDNSPIRDLQHFGLKMKVFNTCILFATILVVNANIYSNLGFMRSVSSRFPHAEQGHIFPNVRSIGDISNRKAVSIGHQTIQKSDLAKSRPLRNVLLDTNAKLLPGDNDQPYIYRTNPDFAMAPNVLNRIRYLQEMRPSK